MAVRSATQEFHTQTTLEVETREEKLERLNKLFSEKVSLLNMEESHKAHAKGYKEKAKAIDIDLEKLNQELEAGQQTFAAKTTIIDPDDEPIDADFKVRASGDDSFDEDPQPLPAPPVNDEPKGLLSGSTEPEEAPKPKAGKARKGKKAKPGKVVGIKKSKKGGA